MKFGTKKKPIFYKVRATKGVTTSQMREGSMRNECYLAIKGKGQRGARVQDIEEWFDRPMRTVIHKLIESGHVEPIYPKA